MSTRTFVVVGSVVAVGLTIGGWRWQTHRSAPATAEQPSPSPIAVASDAPAATTPRSGGHGGPHLGGAWLPRALPRLEPEKQVVVPSPSEGATLPMSDAELAESQRVSQEFAERIKDEVARCFDERVHAKGNITFSYHFKGDGDRWKMVDDDEGVQMTNSTIPLSEDDAAVSCMRQAAKGATMTKTGTLAEGANEYQLYWSWNVT